MTTKWFEDQRSASLLRQVLICGLTLAAADTFAHSQQVQPSSSQPSAASSQTSNGALPEAPVPVAKPLNVPPSHAATQHPSTPPQVTILEDTLIRVWTNEPIDSKTIKDGTPLLFTICEDVIAEDTLAIPRGAGVHGIVSLAKQPGMLTGSPLIVLKIVSLDLGSQSYTLYSHPITIRGTSKTRPTVSKVVDGASVGVLAGSVTAANKDETSSGKVAAEMGKGAAIGAGVGTAVAAATPGPVIQIPAEAQVDFYLAAPITIVPLSQEEAGRLSQGLYAGGPTLYVRDNP